MDDLSDIVSSAIAPKRVKNPASNAGVLSASEQAASDAIEQSPGVAKELQAELARTKDPAKRAILLDPKNNGMALVQTSSDDLSSVIASALAEHGSEKPAAQMTQPQVTPRLSAKEQPGGLVSAAAGAGKAFGSGVLAVQQLAGKGASMAGETFGSDALKSAGDWLMNDATQGARNLEAQNAPYQEANPKSNIGGQVVGIVANPVNKLIPMGGAATSVAGAVAKGAAQGAALNALTSPVTSDTQPFWTEKLKQGAVGAVGGAAGGGLGYGLSKLLNKGIDALKSLGTKVAGRDPATVADEVVTKTLAEAGVTKEEVPAEMFAGLKAQAQEALASGKKVDGAALTRLARAQTLPVPVPMLRGQVRRDPMQFAKEQNLRGIQGVGEPITETLQAQNKALIANLDALGASSGTDVVSAAKPVIDVLQVADKKAQAGVGAAYDAFKNATGKELDVPLQGLAQDYAKTVSEFGDAIPAAIRGKFEGLGLMSGKAQKTFSIGDAEALIKSINRNYDPSNKVQARALDELRRSVQTAITDGAGASAEGTAAAGLAKAARQAAAKRFAAIDATPALKAAIGGVEPDKFIQKFILQGNEKEIGSLMSTLSAESPEAAKALQDSLMAHIKARVMNGATAENGVFSQAQLKAFVTDPNTSARLTQVLGKEKMATLRQLNTVAEDALYAPKASAVNSSNTASAAANLISSEVKGGAVNKLLDITKGIPGLGTASHLTQQGMQSRKAANLINEAITPDVSKQAGAMTLPELSGYGARAGAGYAGSKRAQR